jgi:hypothetical protein
MWCSVQLSTILWGFLHTFLLGILSFCFLFCDISGFGDVDFLKWIWKHSLLLNFLEEFERYWCKLLSKHLVVIIIWSCDFLCREVLNYWLNILIIIGLFRLYIYLLFSCGRLYVSKNLSLSSWLSNLLTFNHS